MNMMRRLEPRTAPPSNDAARRADRFRKLIKLFERDEVEAAVHGLITYLDALDGDPDREQDGDEQDVSANFRDRFDDRPPEYRYADRALREAGDGGMDEDDELVGAEDDFVEHSVADGAGCSISDPGGCEHDGREEEHEDVDERETEQMVQDVPSIAVYAIEPGDDGARPFLGYTLSRVIGHMGDGSPRWSTEL